MNRSASLTLFAASVALIVGVGMFSVRGAVLTLAALLFLAGAAQVDVKGRP